ncbi:MAG: ATP-binding protein [Candidatus Poribacteria bacterium]|nr:ATP-binding protein [Candidatus Poribacteria bacterium]
MRLQWKYTLIINLSVLTILVAFYVLDDIKARNDLNDLYTKGFGRGVIFKDIVETKIRPLVEEKIGRRQALYREEIESALREMKQQTLEMHNVLDINVTFGLDAEIRASLVSNKSEGDRINLTGEDLREIRRKGFKIYNTPPINRRYATAIIIPYQTEFIGRDLFEEQITGFIQVLFEVPIAEYIYGLRLRQLISLIVVSVLLVFIIDMATTRLIMQPLERLMEIIKRAEAGNPESLPQSYSSNEIGRVTYSLVRMLKQWQDAHSKRIAALGQFAAGVSHEIRNPLNTIGMTAQHLKELFSQRDIKSEDIEDAQNLLSIVNDEIERLKRISEQFLTLNRPKKLNLEPTNLNALLDQVLAEFTLPLESAKVKVVRGYSENLPSIQLDRDLIRQAVFNLIQNSVQAMPKGGRIYITTELEETIAGEGIALEIRDTGVGMPEEIQERVFDAYFTTKENEGGMGLGLAISHQIITAHQGKIEIKSKVGMGTAFKICFPLK